MSTYNPIVVRNTEGAATPIDLMSKLFDDRIILLDGEIDDAVVMQLVCCLIELDGRDSKAPVTLLIDSPGGSVSAGLALVDAMSSVRCPVNTVAIGRAASMAAVVLACGARRSAYPHAEILLHQLMTGTGLAQQTDLDIVAAHAASTRRALDELLSTHSSLSPEQVHDLTERDCWLDPRRAKELGLIDVVVGERPQ